MKYIITEEQNLRISILRRLSAVDEMIHEKLYKFRDSYYLNICDYDLEDFISMIIQWVTEKMYYSYFSDIDDNSEEWGQVYNIISSYIESVHHKTISDFYSETCKNTRYF